MSLENEIRDLAYSKWEAAGCPETTIEERNRFWYEAEQQVLKPIVVPEISQESLDEVAIILEKSWPVLNQETIES